MNIEIHPDAQRNFDAKAKELISLVTQIQKPQKPQSGTAPDFYIEHVITPEQIIGEPDFGLVDFTGRDCATIFAHDGKQYGLIDKNYSCLVKLADNIARTQPLSSFLSYDFVRKMLDRWIKSSFRKETDQDFTTYLIQNTEEQIRHYEIWIPIPFTATQETFRLGKILFQTITAETIESWFDIPKDKPNIQTEKIEKHKLQVKRDFQGHVAGIYECQAEPIRAEELAFFHLGNSLSILRLFSSANFDPRLISGAYECGSNMMRKKDYFRLDKEEKAYSRTQKVLDQGLEWLIDKTTISYFRSEELKHFDNLLNRDHLTDFQKQLLDALFIYSKHTLRREIFDKVLYILVALESMLLKSETEPIAQNVGDRMAFITESQATKRQEVSTMFKKIYNERSRYAHHGKEPMASVELLRSFMKYSWLTFASLVQNSEKYKTKEECLNAIDRVKWS